MAYWEVYKNYYANKQEGIGAVIHGEQSTVTTFVIGINFGGYPIGSYPTDSNINVIFESNTLLKVLYSGGTQQVSDIIVLVDGYGWVNLENLGYGWWTDGSVWYGGYNGIYKGVVKYWSYINNGVTNSNGIKVTTFELEEIDKMREYIS